MSSRRKKKDAKKQARLKAEAGQASTGPVIAPGPYRFVYEYVGELRRAEIREALLEEPRRFRRLAFAASVSPRVVESQAGWRLLRDYCEAVERRMASILTTHSVYYWIFLYRRLGVELHSGHENKTDARTLGLVRLTLETAIQKYGRLDGAPDIVAPTSLPIEQWFGGLLKKSFVAAVGRGEAQQTMEALCGQSMDAVPAPFSEDTLVDLYRLEGFAYEYWYMSALMRTIGKGGELRILDSGPDVDRSSEFDELIESYDRRIDESHSRSSNIGVALPADPADRFVALAPVYNVKHLPPVFPPWGTPFQVAEGESTNFQVVPIHIGAFRESHRFAEEAFNRTKGFHLSSLCGVLAGLSWLDLWHRIKDGKLEIEHALNLWQRGYVLAPRAIVDEELLPWTESLMQHWRPNDAGQLASDGSRVLAYLTLDATKQAKIGLWSHGPLYPFVPAGNRVLIDLATIAYRLQNEFYGVRHQQQAKGPLFEYTFRDEIKAARFDLLPDRKLRFDDVEVREVDAAVRIGSTLVLCDCRAMERPLDFELGNVRTIETRCEQFDRKVDQVLSLAEFVRRHPTGRNFDFSWARGVIPFVVSPFVEWIWSRNERLWITSDIPRILSVAEAILFLKTFGASAEA